MFPHRLGVDPGLDPKGPAEGSASCREIETTQGGVQMGSPPGCAAIEIGHHGLVAFGAREGDNPQQLALGGPTTAPDASPNRTKDRGNR